MKKQYGQEEWALLEEEERSKCRDDPSYLPKQYRFGLAGFGHDGIIEKYLNANMSGVALNAGCGDIIAQSANISKFMRRVICGDLKTTKFHWWKWTYRKSPHVPEVAEESIPPLVLDATRLPLTAGSIDVVLALGLYSHTWDDHNGSDWWNGCGFPEKTFWEFHRVNKQGGHLIVCNNTKEPMERYTHLGQLVGYRLLESGIGRDMRFLTSTAERYVLCFQK